MIVYKRVQKEQLHSVTSEKASDQLLNRRDTGPNILFT